MKDVFQVVSTVVIIGLSAVTVWLMLKDKKNSDCNCKSKPRHDSNGGIQPPSCGIAYARGQKNNMSVVK